MDQTQVQSKSIILLYKFEKHDSRSLLGGGPYDNNHISIGGGNDDIIITYVLGWPLHSKQCKFQQIGFHCLLT